MTVDEASARELPVFEIFDQDFKTDPFPWYRTLREAAPAHRVRMTLGANVWLVTGYELAKAVLADERFSKETVHAEDSWRELALVPEDPDALVNRMLLMTDPPDHERLRRLVSRAFTSRSMVEMRPRIMEVADELVANFAGRGSADLIREFAFPLPARIICDLLGVPDDHRARFEEYLRLLCLAEPEDMERMPAVFADLTAELAELVERKRAEPDGHLLSALVGIRDGSDRLSDRELVSMAFQLMYGAQDTTVNLIGNGLLALLEHPAAMAQLRADSELVPQAVEEILRFDPPVETATPRYALEPMEIGGMRVRKGEVVLVSLASALRDPAQFENPEVFDVHREVRGQLAFGHGIHYCLGAVMARVKGEVALRALLGGVDDLRLDEETPLVRNFGFIMRGLRSLPVRFTPRQG
ncbi:cytochrome P450 [Amycolatopsis sp. NPDC047767]|uniref:cytochrome P450 family protein n=1 Tax=Amycolatopsis sp. NPDC047767 TaxID=3156765 RepID=UPI003454AD24